MSKSSTKKLSKLHELDDELTHFLSLKTRDFSAKMPRNLRILIDDFIGQMNMMTRIHELGRQSLVKSVPSSVDDLIKLQSYIGRLVHELRLPTRNATEVNDSIPQGWIYVKDIEDSYGIPRSTAHKIYLELPESAKGISTNRELKIVELHSLLEAFKAKPRAKRKNRNVGEST